MPGLLLLLPHQHHRLRHIYVSGYIKYRNPVTEHSKQNLAGLEHFLQNNPAEGILSTFSLPGKNNDQENELQNIKIATNH